jgi:hypothetical protein
MQAPFASPPAHNNSRDAALYGRHLSIARFSVSIAMVLITLAIVFVQKGERDTTPREHISAIELASGMPLP